MRHDFIPYSSPGSPRKDSKGNDCNNVGGIMDYHPTKDHDVKTYHSKYPH